MKALIYNNRSILPILFLAMGGVLLSQVSLAQRFNHGGGAPRGGGAPAFHPAPAPSRPVASPAPRQQFNRPAPQQPEVRPAPMENRTINGGSRVGNHDFNRNMNVHDNVMIHQNVDVHQHVDVRDHVNVYHTGGYRGVHPYYYHPYRPSYWGPRWHPFGFFAASLAADAVLLSIANRQYYYEDGVYYSPANGGYSVVPPPVGAVVSYLPQGYETTMVGSDTYYYYGGAFYINNGQGYQVVPAPPGAVIVQLPVGAIEQQINGNVYEVYNNTYYQPISQDGQDAYEVVTPN
jgi:hypothetical protein